MPKTLLARLSITASLVALSLTPAAARDIDAVISFGDSLSDNGNLYAVTGGTTPTSPPYYQGRYSNGPVFTEYLNGALQRAGAAALGGIQIDPTKNQDYAFGGARTDTLPALTPGIPDQIGLFLKEDGVFAPNDVVTLYGGANDIFQNPVPTPAGIVAVATQAAQNIGAAAGTLSKLGAPTLVVVNLPDLGLTPAYNGTPTTMVAGTLAADTFNAALTQAVYATAAANPGTDTFLVDVERVQRAIVADPGRFGFTNVTDGCVNVPTCVAAPQDVQNRYLYWDAVHPTAAAHQIFGSLVLDYLTAGEQAVNVGSMSETAILDRYEGVSSAYARSRDVLAGGASVPGLYASVGGNWYDRGDGGRMHGYDHDVATLRLGYDTMLGDYLFGGAVSYSNGAVDNAPITYDTQAFAADLYAGTRVGGFDVGATAGIAHADFNDIERVTLVPGIVNGGADTNAVVYDVGAEIAYPMVFGDLTATPSLALTYLHFDVDGFTESGLAARIQYDGYDRDALFGAANLDLAYQTEAFGRPAKLTGRIGWEDNLSNDDAGIVSRISGSPSHDSFAAFDDLSGRGFVLGAGAEASVTDAIAASVSYSVGFGDTIDVSHAAKGMLTVKF
ncbi:autotransporter domain-containing protein [Jiella sonneratiae]|uniref:Autotransporter domain-containing protein n=1 Tax=Jiella sonneratiae TaxID=2816856 RepID=A0ABS3J4C5_9HYPH|nr:autotransporter domain-containing protein [Jiella sonneratiae]MBO0904530.1 autotransporter domain-containing protein [Jiella sonneratiae]